MSAPRIGLAIVAVAATVAAGVFAALYFTNGSDEEAAAEQCENRNFGHIAALQRDGDTYRMRLDPAWFTSGVTANEAAAEDGVVEPGEPVPNDNYRVEEGHRLLTYLVPPDVEVTVLTNNDTGILSTPITVSELTDLVAGKTPIALFEPLETGVWIRYHVDTVCTIDQQYLP
jgi:hypothetical protein